MRHRTVHFFAALALSAFSSSVSADVVINELLFDPAGTDTGFEKIELYNPGTAAMDLSGWELYPDGIGYFSFPSGFVLSAKALAIIHLHASGTNDAGNLYHPAATGNMGDSSGSVALFRPGGRTKDTIADFVRYQKLGKGERKTWESDAAKAGLWTVGSFVDISAFTAGVSIGLASDGVRGSTASWQISTTPSIGSANTLTAASPPAALPASAPPPTPPAPAPSPVPSLGANAGLDALATAGAVVQFEGVAFGLDGKPLDGARYFWNFGDGSTQDARSPTHIFHFPGTYHVNLLVQSGHYAGSDWRTVTVLPAELAISEVKPGGDGFIEIANAASARVDIGGMFLTDDRRVVFRIPSGTVVGPESAVVLPALNTRLAPTSYLDLRDARGVMLDAARFSGSLRTGASWERDGQDFKAQPKPTPGTFAAPGTVRQTAAATPRINPVPPPNPPSPIPPRPAEPPAAPAREPSSVAPPVPTLPRETAAVGTARSMSYAFFAASIILGLTTAAGIVILKRKLS